jgi:hypothetical protein
MPRDPEIANQEALAHINKEPFLKLRKKIAALTLSATSILGIGAAIHDSQPSEKPPVGTELDQPMGTDTGHIAAETLLNDKPDEIDTSLVITPKDVPENPAIPSNDAQLLTDSLREEPGNPEDDQLDSTANDPVPDNGPNADNGPNDGETEAYDNSESLPGYHGEEGRTYEDDEGRNIQVIVSPDGSEVHVDTATGQVVARISHTSSGSTQGEETEQPVEPKEG